MHLLKYFFSTALILMIAQPSFAQQNTKIVVRARAKNAKFIGTETGGAVITILNASTGDTLAHGLTKGGTGNTAKLIKTPVKRYDKMSEPGDGKFETTLSLKKPTFVTIKATANTNNDGTEVTSSTQKWLIPGKDITGDGVTVEIPGFYMANHLPKANKLYRLNQKIPIRTHIVMMCGCSTKPGGLWNSNDYDIKALISKEGKVIQKIPLAFAGETSFYESSFKPKKAGSYQITVYAFNDKTGNTGVAKTHIRVE